MSTQSTVESERQEQDMSPGVFCWNELMTHDTAASAKFYTALFGWKTDVHDMGNGMKYTMWKKGDLREGGMFQLPSEASEMPATWMAYVTVADLGASTAKAKSLGAKICKENVSVQGMGRFSIITDPHGAMLGLWEPAKE